MSTLLQAFEKEELAEYIGGKYDKPLEFYAERIADSYNDSDTIAEQVDDAMRMILDTEDSEWSSDFGSDNPRYSQEFMEALADVIYDMIVDWEE